MCMRYKVKQKRLDTQNIHISFCQISTYRFSP